MRLLLDDGSGSTPRDPSRDLSVDEIAALYDVPPTSPTWLRANFVSTLDGAATGRDGLSGSINTRADHVVFELLRALSHAVVLGAGTARAEGYGRIRVPAQWKDVRVARGLPPELPLVLVSRSAVLPSRVIDDRAGGPVYLVTHQESPGLPHARAVLGDVHVLVCGDADVDVARCIDVLHERGWTALLTEGGPTLFSHLLGASVVDELDLSLAPRIVVGEANRITHGASLDGRFLPRFLPRVLVEQDGTVMGRWVREQPLRS